MKYGVQPRQGLVLVRMVARDKETRVGSIVIPSNVNNELFAEAEVLAVGPGIWDAGKLCGTQDLSPGQRVLIKSGTQVEALRAVQKYLPFTVAGEKVALINQQDIFAILNHEEVAVPPALTLAK